MHKQEYPVMPMYYKALWPVKYNFLKSEIDSKKDVYYTQMNNIY